MFLLEIYDGGERRGTAISVGTCTVLSAWLPPELWQLSAGLLLKALLKSKLSTTMWSNCHSTEYEI